MKLLCLIFVLLVCFCDIYCKIDRRLQFICKVEIVEDISALERDRDYLVQDKELFLDDIELFYKDSRCKKRLKKDYIRATPNLLWQVAEQCCETDKIVFPLLVNIHDDSVSISNYEELWRKNVN